MLCRITYLRDGKPLGQTFWAASIADAQSYAHRFEDQEPECVLLTLKRVPSRWPRTSRPANAGGLEGAATASVTPNDSWEMAWPAAEPPRFRKRRVAPEALAQLKLHFERGGK